MNKTVALAGAGIVLGTALLAFFYREPLVQAAGQLESLMAPESALIWGMERAAAQLNKKTPVMLDDDLRWDSASVGPGARVTYKYTYVNHPAAGVDRQAVLRDLLEPLGASVCTDEATRSSLELGATLSYLYQGNDGIEVARLDIDATSCAAHWQTGAQPSALLEAPR